MTTPHPDDPTALSARAGATAGREVTPADGAPIADGEERVHVPRLLVWLLVFAGVVVGVVLYFVYAKRLSPLL
ncbi:MAG TPA: hypothetical protein VEA99_08800 [Gemmatimonadaceae bacterium]|nr:hypothetical protein [Gemmatimonadaceae bacterium]